MCRLKEAIGRGEARISVCQKLVVDQLFDRAVPQNNGTHDMDPNHLAKCIGDVLKSRRPGACVGANDGYKFTASLMVVVLVNTCTDSAVAERMPTPKDD